MDKNSARIALANQRKKMTFKKRQTKSLKIMENLLPLLEGKKNVAIYLNTKDEVNTIDFLDYFIQNFDVVSSSITNDFEMEFYQIKNSKHLVRGYQDIMEPEDDVKVNKEDIEVMIVPMLGYDTRCQRMGYGKGYYDKYLSDFKGLVIGLAFTEQEFNHIPTEPHDVRMDYVVTEREIIKKPRY